MQDDYQYDYADLHPTVMYNQQGRERKARTTLAVLQEYFAAQDLQQLQVLDIGASTGFIDNYLAAHFQSVTGIDIDEQAIAFADAQFSAPNLQFKVGDAMQLNFPDQSFNVVLCAHIYEHVPDPVKMMREITRVLRPGGVCYFAAGNRLAVREPHYNLPFLSVMPKFLSHLYLRILGKGRFYYETHLSYWGLKKLINPLELIDYTPKMLDDPGRYHMAYLLVPGSGKHKIARWIIHYAYWLCPGYVWLLRKT